jgi:hypothetical protein
MAQSSFGPLGRSKVLLGQAGAVVITRDCSQILEQEYESTHSIEKVKDFSSIIKKACQRHAQQYGDGSMAFFLFVSSLMETFFATNKTIAGINRVNILFAVQNILFVFHHHISRIYDSMTVANLMFAVENNSPLVLRGLLLNMLVPASNGNIAANLANLVTSWCEANQFKSISDFPYQDILNNFDVYFVSSSIGNMSESYVVPGDQVLVEGNCRDINFLSAKNKSPNGAKPFRYVCISRFGCEGSDAVGSSTVTLQLAGDLTSLSSVKAYDVNTVVMMNVLKLLAQEEIQVILSSASATKLSPGILYHMSRDGIVLIDSIPPAQLAFLGKSREVAVCADPRAFLDQFLDRAADTIGHFTQLERVSMGFGAGQSYLRLCGCIDREDRGKRRGGGIRQAVVRGSGSPVVTGMYRRLLKRSLKVIQAFHAHKACIYALPGCGINEMSWSIIWDEITAILENGLRSQDKACHKEECTPLQKLSLELCLYLLCRYDTHTQPIESLQSMSVRSMLEAIETMKSQVDGKAFQSLLQVCRAISKAYFTIPQLLLHNRMSTGRPNTAKNSIEANRITLIWKQHTASVYTGSIYDKNNNDFNSIRRNIFGSAIKMGLLEREANNQDNRLVAASLCILYYSLTYPLINNCFGVLMFSC